MKQYITVVELKQLSEAACEKLLEWMLKHGYSRELTIGQMIEFLTEHGYAPTSTYIDDSFSYVITVGGRGEMKEVIEIGWTNYCGKSEELCDALWEAVKEVLNK